MERTYNVSGEGTMGDNWHEAKEKLRQDLLRDGFEQHGITFDFKPMIDPNNEHDVTLTVQEDGDELEVYINGLYMNNVKFDDLSEEMKEQIGLINHTKPDMIVTQGSKALPEPKDMTLHVFDDDTRRLWITCDVTEVFPDDPGKGTPIIVHANIDDERFSSTLACALDQGILEHNLANYEHELRNDAYHALEMVGNRAHEWLNMAVSYIKVYGQPKR